MQQKLTSGAEGKPIQPGTVIGHILESALQAGKQVPLRRLAECDDLANLPNEADWEKMDNASIKIGCDPVESNQRRDKEILVEMVGPEVEMDFTQKTDEQKAGEKVWYAKIKWWVALKRAKAPVSFGGGGKRQRT
mmetsp:Transcript_66771/g.158384  ORF Transcript_66771/g.158384 Transcript_66771/m.158384 type:complete len:135 (+) Transcript_66771:256-660(+)